MEPLSTYWDAIALIAALEALALFLWVIASVLFSVSPCQLDTQMMELRAC
jgi:hypothetical protein